VSARPVQAAEVDILVGEVEALYEGDGPPARKTLVVSTADGTPRIHLGRLFIACAVCEQRSPQSQSRQSPEARRVWVAMHLRCPD
jgi:hypothetical protein